MATVALQAVGTAIGGPVGGFIGAAVGQYIDQNFIFPTLFPQPDVEGPKLDDFSFSGGTEGTPLNECFGPETRVPGTVIWVSEVRQVKIEEESGGDSGGGGQTQTTYEYYVDIAVVFSKSTDPGGVAAVDRVWAESGIVYDDTPDFDETSDQLEVETTAAGRMRVVNADGSVDLTGLKSGKPADLSGFTNGANNETGVKVWKSFVEDIGPPKVTKVVFNKKDHVDELAGATATIFQALPKFEKTGLQDITIYKGTKTQSEDPTILAAEDSERVSGYRGICYVVIQDLFLGNYGNRIPTSWEGGLQQDTSIDLQTLVERLMARAGWASSEYDATDLAGIDVKGYFLRGPTETTKALQPLMLAYDFLAQDDNGTLRFIQRQNATVTTIPDEDLAAHEVGSDSPRPSKVTDISGVNLPAEVNVSYIDREKDLQRGSQPYRRRGADTDQTETVDLNVTLDGDEARAIAARLLWQPWTNQQRHRVTLPPSYLFLQENDVITFSAFGQTLTTIIEKIDVGQNGLIEVEGLIDNGLVFDVEAVVEDPELAGDTIYVAPDMELEILDIPPMVNTGPGYDDPVILFAAAAADPAVQFLGAAIREQIEGFFPPSTSTVVIEQAPTESTIGVCLTALGGGVSPNRWDRVNTVQVEIVDGELSSKADVDLVNGFNRCAIKTSTGWEVLAFKTATLIGARTYELSDLWRGMRDTEDFIDGHAVGDSFVFLNSPGIVTHVIGSQDVGKSNEYQAFPQGGDEADFQTFVTTNTNAENLVPFRPNFIRATRTVAGPGAGDVTLTWIARTRKFRSPFKGSVNGTGEEYMTDIASDEQYRVRLYDPVGTTVATTYTPIGGIDFSAGSPSLTIAAADITAAGYTDFDPITVDVAMRSAQLGFGRARKVTV